jgi:hypothetical protein
MPQPILAKGNARERNHTMSTRDAKSSKKATQDTAKPASGAGTELSKGEQDDLLEEALEETFPASDPMASMHFTSSKKKKKG